MSHHSSVTRHRPLDCRAVGRLLHAYLDAEVAHTSALAVAEHLDDCRRCGLEAEAYRWLQDSLSRLRPPDDPAQIARLRAFADALANLR
jgi:anti-sigma factor RsiW